MRIFLEKRNIKKIKIMNNFILYLVPLTIFSILIGNLLSKKFKIVDKPGTRKIHKFPVPLSGGISLGLLFNILVFALLYSSSEFTYFLITILICFNLIFLMGLLDYYLNLNYKIRVFISIVVFIFFINTSSFNSNITIENFYIDYFFLENFEFKFKLNILHSMMFTIFCLLFFQFSTNMLDGINGLLCLIYSS